MAGDKSDIKIQARATKFVITKDRALLWIQRGTIALILVIVAYLSILAGFGIWRTVAWLLILLFLMGVAIIDTQRIMKWIEDIQKIFWELK